MKVTEIVNYCHLYFSGIEDIKNESLGKKAIGLGKLFANLVFLPISVVVYGVQRKYEKIQSHYQRLDNAFSNSLEKTQVLSQQVFNDMSQGELVDYLLEKIQGLKTNSLEGNRFQNVFHKLDPDHQEKLFTQLMDCELLESAMLHIPEDTPSLKFKLSNHAPFSREEAKRNGKNMVIFMTGIDRLKKLETLVLNLKGLGRGSAVKNYLSNTSHGDFANRTNDYSPSLGIYDAVLNIQEFDLPATGASLVEHIKSLTISQWKLTFADGTVIDSSTPIYRKAKGIAV